METIEIIRNETTKMWDAKFSNPETKALFGTDTIPTPYTLAMPKAQVVVEVQARHQNYKVF